MAAANGTTQRGSADPARHRSSRRRGAVAAVIAVGAVALLGMAALATEAGIWLVTRRNAQNGADAAAYAGAVTLAIRGGDTVGPVVRQTVARNGFAASSTTAVGYEIGNWAAGGFTAGASPANAVRVEIRQVQPMGLARLIGSAAPVVWGGAVAVIETGGALCTLTIPPPGGGTSQVSGTTNIAGNVRVNAPGCLMVSNKTTGVAINVQNTAAAANLVAGALRGSGQCYNCDGVPRDNLPGGYTDYAPPTDNPFASLDNRTQNPMPTFSNAAGTCAAPIYRDAAGVVLTGPNARNDARYIDLTPVTATSGTPTATCVDITVRGGQILRLAPGTHYFNSATLSMSASDASITCHGCSAATGEGVTLVFTGSSAGNVGNLQITGGDFNILAPGIGHGVPGIYDGVAIYRDALARVSNSANDAMRLEGNPSSVVSGAVYAPTSEIKVSGNSGTGGGTGGCTAYVAGEITFTGNASISISACPGLGLNPPLAKYVRLAQ